MIAATLQIARGTAGRTAAAALAVALGAGFVAVVLLGGALLKRTAYDGLAAPYVAADVVVTPPDGATLDDAAVQRIAAVPGVAAAQGRIDATVEVLAAGRTQYLGVEQTSALRTTPLARGVRPTAPGQVALPGAVADRLRAGTGSQVVVRSYAAGAPSDTRAVVVGLLRDATLGSGPLVAAPGQARSWSGGHYAEALVVAAPGTDATALRERLASRLAAATTVLTGDERSRRAVAAVGRGTDVLTGLVLSFAVLAMFVAAVVIANTFAVLLAQRTRQLALLRCIGATRRQVRGQVLGEAAALGLVASVVGTAVATGLAALALTLLARATPGLPGGIEVTPTTVVVPVLLGVAATVLAALPAARAATRVAPLAALRPEVAPDLRTRASRLRVVLAVLLLATGGLALVGGVALGRDGSAAGVALALLGGAVSFLGVLVGAVLIVPRAVALLGGTITRLSGSGAARLATANALRNPRRTTTTTAALLIGVTLVSLVTVGAATTRASLDATLDSTYPVDVIVGPDLPGPDAATAAPAAPDGALPPGVLDAVRGVRGVDRVVPRRTARLEADVPVGPRAVSLQGAPPDAARAVLADPSALAALAPGTAVAPASLARALGLVDGAALRLGARTLTVRTSDLPGTALLLTGRDLASVAPDPVGTRLWARLVPGADPGTAVGDVRDAVAAVPGATAVQVEGAAAERATYQRAIDVLLLVVVALLAVAVVIALVGVANTLSLSVVERTGESALLRALGLTRGQLRAMLAVEGTLVAGVGALLGVALGTLYGWAGAASLLGSVTGGVRLAVPGGRLAAVLAVAVAAGLLASVLPARRAARTPPAASLGA